MSLPVQQTNIIAIIRTNLPTERQQVLERIQETTAQLVELEHYLTLLNNIGREAGVPNNEQPNVPTDAGAGEPDRRELHLVDSR